MPRRDRMPAPVTRSTDRRPGSFGRSGSRVAALARTLLYLGVTAGVAAEVPGDAPDERARLLQLQREAVELLKRAGQAGAARDEAARAIQDAARRLEALGAEPEPRASLSDDPLSPALR